MRIWGSWWELFHAIERNWVFAPISINIIIIFWFFWWIFKFLLYFLENFSYSTLSSKLLLISDHRWYSFMKLRAIEIFINKVIIYRFVWIIFWFPLYLEKNLSNPNFLIMKWLFEVLDEICSMKLRRIETLHLFSSI